MPDDKNTLTEAEVAELVARHHDHIGDALKAAMATSFSEKGARHLALYAVAEMDEVHVRVYGKGDKPPKPALREWTLKALQDRFPPTEDSAAG
ncbi:hypothetical protein AB0454_35630 [Streptomyces sp. NPDC093509]|uniref:hypothetical protein n=1 Tax=Streptomyces sp. NPDC093509 TaxID=3154982 RepID=UPI00344B50B1